MDHNYKSILNHYNSIWGNFPNELLLKKGPIEKLNPNFRVLEYPPTKKREMWTYATCGMANGLNGSNNIELHMFSSVKDVGVVEILTAVAYYHKNTAKLDLNHTVNFGQSWQNNSICTYGFISLPYLDGPDLETMQNSKVSIKFYWLIPITKKEVEYKIDYGTNELEVLFEEKGLDYLNPSRGSLI